VAVTREAGRAGALLGIDLLDHVVVGRSSDTHPGFVSLLERGLYVPEKPTMPGAPSMPGSARSAAPAPAGGSQGKPPGGTGAQHSPASANSAAPA
jgi:hypothetical protein